MRNSVADSAHPAPPDQRYAEPLVVDLDGTLSRSDTLIEGVLQVVRQRPGALPSVLGGLAGGRASFKQAVSDAALVQADALPYREDLLAYLTEQRAQGRRIVLATAADRRVADAVARHIGLFDEVLATEAGHNLKGEAKLAAIRDRVGARFHYAGDSKADVPVWNGSSGALLVGPGRRHRAHLDPAVPVVAEFGTKGRATARTWTKALRLHQWLKNVLICVPLLTGDTGFGPAALLAVLGAFVAFSLLASATYVVNDLLDLPSDRRHPRKRLRPLASGAISIGGGVAAALGCLLLAVLMCAMLPPQFSLVLLGYWLLTTVYSMSLKRYVLLDVLTLAVLYTTRIVAGAAVLAISMSPWLLAFSAAVFFSLALVKRCSELVLMERQGRSGASGRDYQVQDLSVLVSLGTASAVSAVVIFGLFISQPTTVARYAQPDLLWLAALALAYWLSRLWIKTTRGEMHDDPLVYALVDRGCRITLLFIAAVTLVARFSLPGIGQ